MKEKVDKRVERTKRDLKLTFLQLIEEKQDFNAVTIIEIVKRANYNRGTFYAHYKDKESLLNEIVEKEIEGFIDALRDPYKGKKPLMLKFYQVQH